MTEITASKYVKSQGLPSVAYVARKVNKHPQRLFEWYHANFALFEAVVAGVKALNVSTSGNTIILKDLPSQNTALGPAEPPARNIAREKTE